MKEEWRFVDVLDIDELMEGDILQHRAKGEGYIVVRKGAEVVAVRMIGVANPDEWRVRRRVLR